MDKNYHYFLEIVQTGSISAAARNLRISQPALSLAIKNLESQLQTELFVRSRKGASLTENGQRIYELVTAMKIAEKNLLGSITKDTLGRKLAIGSVDSIALSLVSELDFEFDSTKLVVDNSSVLSEMVLSGKLDVAFIVQPQKKNSSLVYKTIGREPLYAVAAKQTNSRVVRLLAYNAKSSTYMHVHEALISAGLQPQPIFHSTDPHLLAEAAIQGKGVAVLPSSLVDRIGSDKIKRVYSNITLMRPIVRIARQDRWLPESLDVFESKIVANLL